MALDFPSALWPEGEHRSLLRAAMLDGSSAVAAFHEWRERITFDDLDISSLRLLPLLRWNMGRLGVKDPLISRLENVCRTLRVDTAMKLKTMREMLLVLHGTGIPRLLLKGAALGQRYYFHPSLRPMGDCDILIPYQERRRALEKLGANGWRAVADDTSRHYSADMRLAFFDGLGVELHWRSGIESIPRDDRMMWRASEELEFHGTPCRAFCAVDEIIHACRHGFNWSPETPPMRWLADCAMIVRQSGAGMDWNRLAERAGAMEQTLCVRRSLEWIRREGCAPVPAEALQKLRAQGTRRRERRIYALKAKPRDWGVSALLYAAFLNRELPCWHWPLHLRRVLRYFAGQFALADHADTLRYFVYHFRREAGLRKNTRLEAMLGKMALMSGMRRISTTWLHDGFTGMLEEPSTLCWNRRKVKLEGFAFAHDGGPTGPLRVTHRGAEIKSIAQENLRPDIAKSRPSSPNALKSGFSILFDLPEDKCELIVEHRCAGGSRPLFSVKIDDFQIVNGAVLPAGFPSPVQQMDFGKTQSEKYLLSGWSSAEGTSRWSDGNKAEIIFSLEEIEPLNLEIKMRPFLFPGRVEEQAVTLFLNHQKLRAWKLSRGEFCIYTAQLPRKLLKKNNLLTLDLPQAASPASLGSGNDERKLSILVEWMKLDFPAGSSKKEDPAGFAGTVNQTTMGAIHFSIDTGLVRVLQAGLPLGTFVETGTFEGASIQAMRPLFKKIFSVELSADLHRAAGQKFRDDPSVKLLQGNSPELLRTLRPELEKESVLYWLDAHWSGGPTAGEKSQCPLLQELDAIGALNENSVVLIDDARLFLSTPPAPLDAGEWPDFDSIARKLFLLSPGHVLSVVNDVIAYVPRGVFPALREYARDHSPDLLVELGKAGLYDALKKDRDELAADIEKLTTSLEQSETDRAARLQALNETTARLAESETDRAARLQAIERLDQLLKETTERLAVSETDREARLDVIKRQDQLLKEKSRLIEELERKLGKISTTHQ